MSNKKKVMIINISLLLITILLIMPLYIILKERADNYLELMQEAFADRLFEQYSIYQNAYSETDMYIYFAIFIPVFVLYPIMQIVSGSVNKIRKYMIFSFLYLIINAIIIFFYVYSYLNLGVDKDTMILFAMIYQIINIAFSGFLKWYFIDRLNP
ncbi:MAG: hypothetical protein CVV56_02105 [Tenericutes bacterium HGW-Tenericutes-1]|nr:MAG: hypothetical protein CVV56_02105 [Tenericutes bacterium HGW-Tenericutes-1]